MNKAFSHFAWQHGLIGEFDEQYPSSLMAWDDSPIELKDGDGYFGFVYSGEAMLMQTDSANASPTDDDTEGLDAGHVLRPGMIFASPGNATITPTMPNAKGIIISRKGYKNLFLLAGPIEHEGRLKYIDGCTDSLLVPPIRKGDPCLNLLYFPPGIDQTRHTHPSDRIGLIASGRGLCHYWTEDEPDVEKQVVLLPGMLFRIHTDGHHKFSTPFDEHMRVIAFHPDSDFGPTDEVHPMINRTIVDGVSASLIESIRTK